jgi:hypothetical protein
MNFEIRTIPRSEKEVKRLIKKYPSIKVELQKLNQVLTSNPTHGINIGKGIYKIRLAIKSNGKGKSGGARVISFVLLKSDLGIIYLTSIYDKSERPTISTKELIQIITEIK